MLSPKAISKINSNLNSQTTDLDNFNCLFLVMDYVDSDLKKVFTSVAHGTALNETHIVVILYNLLCAVKYMHSANILHRDLKPANVLIHTDS
jgi:serine/threonine protein kinase